MLINAILCADEKQNEATQQGQRLPMIKEKRPSKRPWPVHRRPENKGLVS